MLGYLFYRLKMFFKYALFILICFIIFSTSVSQNFNKVSESKISNPIALNNKLLFYKDGKVAIVSSVQTDIQRFSIGYLKLTDTVGTTYFEKYIKSKEDTLKMNLYDLQIKESEVELLCRKTLDFTASKFDSYFTRSRLNLLRYDFSGNETYNNLDTTDSTATFWSLFYLTYNNYGKPICLFTPKTFGTINTNVQFNQYDDDGNVEILKQVSSFKDGDTSTFDLSKYIVGKNDNYYAIGTEYYKDINGANIRTGIVFKVNSYLEIEWKKRLENQNLTDQISFYNLMELNDGNILAFSNQGQFVFDSDGDLKNRFEIKSNSNNNLTLSSRVIQNSDGDLIISGNKYNNANSKESSYIAKIDLEGNVKWEKTFEYINNSTILDLIEFKDNNYLFLEFQYGSNTLNLYKFGDVTTSVLTEESLYENIYPNPAKEEINISYDKMINSIEILDLNGKEILSNISLLPQMEQSIKIDYLNAGTYFIRINDTLYKRFVKE